MIFLTKTEIIEFHRRTIIEQGGIHGIRDESLLESAVISAENRAYYENSSVTECAATYAYHLIMAHAFFDGNKRIGAIVAEVFLEIHGFSINLQNDVLQEIYLSVASGEISRSELEKLFSEIVIQAAA